MEYILQRFAKATSPEGSAPYRVRGRRGSVSDATHNRDATTATVLDRVREWMEEHGLELADAKTEAVVFMVRRAFRPPLIMFDGHSIRVTKELEYLSVTLDPRRSFTAHLSHVGVASCKAALAVARLMPNIGGPTAVKRKLLSLVAESRLLYVAPTWSRQAAAYKINRKAFEKAQRTVALRTCRAYRTVFGDDLLADIIPGDLLVEERTAIYRARRNAGQ